MVSAKVRGGVVAMDELEAREHQTKHQTESWTAGGSRPKTWGVLVALPAGEAESFDALDAAECWCPWSFEVALLRSELL